jgi:hypothetical protein
MLELRRKVIVDKQNIHFESYPCMMWIIARDLKQMTDQCALFVSDVPTIISVRLTPDRHTTPMLDCEDGRTKGNERT